MIICNNPACSAHKKGTDQLSSAYLDFAGRWYCSKCRTPLLPNERTKLTVTAESNAYYVRSERLFKEGWLLKNDLFGFTPEKAKAEAIDLCRRSVTAGNPYATVALADYYEQGVVDEELSYTKRWNNAVNCNAAVAFNQNYITYTDPAGKQTNLDSADAEALRFEAAMNIMRLLLSAPGSISASVRSSYLKQAQATCRSAVESHAVGSDSPIYGEYTSLLHKHRKNEKPGKTQVALNELSKICEDMTGKRRPPLLYICCMTRGELERVGVERLQIGKKRVTLMEFCEGSGIKLFIAKILGGDFDQFAAYSIPAVTDFAQNGDSFYVCIYNTRKPQGISQELVNKIWSRLLDDYQTELRGLIGMHVLNDYVFTYDDVKMLGSRRNARVVIDELKSRIRDYFDISE